MGNFCEQYGILPMAPSQRNHIKHRNEKHHKQSFWKKQKSFKPNEYYNINKRFVKKPNKHYKKHDNKKFDKKKIKCFKCDNVSLKVLIPINWLINPRIFM